MSVVCDVCSLVEVVATGSSLVQRGPIECGVSECDGEASTVRSPWPHRGCRAINKERNVYNLNWFLTEADVTSII